MGLGLLLIAVDVNCCKCSNGAPDWNWPFCCSPHCGEARNIVSRSGQKDEDLCKDKQCGEVCATSMGMLPVRGYCQPDGSCGMNSAPNCKEGRCKLVDESCGVITTWPPTNFGECCKGSKCTYPPGTTGGHGTCVKDKEKDCHKKGEGCGGFLSPPWCCPGLFCLTGYCVPLDAYDQRTAGK